VNAAAVQMTHGVAEHSTPMRRKMKMESVFRLVTTTPGLISSPAS